MELNDLSNTEEKEATEGIALQELGNKLPLEKVQYAATIATLASKRVKEQSYHSPKSNQASGIQRDPEGDYQRYSSLLKDGMEDTIRNELALDILSSKLDTIKELQLDATEANNPEVLKGLLDLEVGYDVEAEKLSVIEREAAEYIVDEGTNDDARREVDEEELNKEIADSSFKSYRQREADRLSKDLVMQTAIMQTADKAGINFNTGTDLLKLFVPGAAGAILDQNVKTKLDPFLPGTDLAEQHSTFQAMSLDQQNVVIKEVGVAFEDNPIHALVVLGYLNNLTDFDVWMENAGGVLDTMAIVGLAAAPLKGAIMGAVKSVKTFLALREAKVATASVTAGNRSSAVEQVVAVEETVRKGDLAYDSQVAQEAAELMLEKQLLPISQYTGVGISGELRTGLGKITAAAKEFLASPQSKLLNNVERTELIRKVREDFSSQVSDTFMAHTEVMRNPKGELSEGVTDDLFGSVYHVFYGSKDGKGFSTVEDANAAAGHLKLKDFKVTPIEVNGVHYIKVAQRVDSQTGFISTVDRSQLNPRLNIVSRFIGSKSGLMGLDAIKAGHLSTASREATMAAAKKFEKIKAQVPKGEIEYLDDVIQKGTLEHNGVWYSVDTLKNRFKFTDAQVAGYKAFQAEEDLAHLIENASRYTPLNAAGFKTVSLNKPIQGLDSFTAKPVTSIENPSNKNIWNASTRKFENIENSEALAALEAKGYKVLQLEGAVDSDLITPVQFILLKEADGVINPLQLMQVSYRPGGRIRYENKHFLKLARLRNGPGSVPVILRAKTFGVGEVENVRDAARTYQEAAQVWLKGGSNAEMRAASKGRFENLKVFEDVIGKKNLESMARHPEIAFEVVKDGEILPSVNKIIANKRARFLAEDVNETNTIQRMIAIKGSSKSQRGERLPMFGENRVEDFDYGNPAPILSPYETAAESITRAMSLMSIENFKTRQTQLWFNTYSGVLNHQDNLRQKPLGWLFESDDVKYIVPGSGDGNKADDLRMIAEAKTMQGWIETVISTPTTGEKLRGEFMEGLISKMTPTLKRFGVTEDKLEDLEKLSPGAFIRSVVYQTKLGLGNPKQPATQLQASALMMTVEPVHGTQSVLTTPILGLMLMSENEGTLANLARKIVRIAPGSDAKIVQEGVEVLKKSNNWRIDAGTLAEHQLKAVTAPTMFKKMLKLGEQPFLNSERFNKIAATYASFLKWRKANPTAKITDDVVNHVGSEGNRLVASMDKVDQAQWQRGALGVVTQFWGYPMRALEMMAPVTIGGSKQFTTAEKWQIAMGQLAMHGVGGTTGVGPGRSMRHTLRQEYLDRFSEEPPKEFMDILEKGMLSGLLLPIVLDADEVNYHAKGLNFLESGPGTIITKIYEGDLTNLLDVDIAGVKTLVDVGGDLGEVGKAVASLLPLDPSVTLGDSLWGVSTSLKNLLVENISSLSEADKLLWALQYEQTMTKNGELVDSDFTTRQAIFKFFGIDSSKGQSTFADQQFLKDYAKQDAAVVKELSKHFRIFITNRLVDKEGADKDWAHARAFYFSRIPEDRRDAAFRKIVGNVTRDRAFQAKKKLTQITLPKGVNQ